jgi:hypothetical protein
MVYWSRGYFSQARNKHSTTTHTFAGAQKEKGYTLFVLQRKPGQTA